METRSFPDVPLLPLFTFQLLFIHLPRIFSFSPPFFFLLAFFSPCQLVWCFGLLPPVLRTGGCPSSPWYHILLQVGLACQLPQPSLNALESETALETAGEGRGGVLHIGTREEGGLSVVGGGISDGGLRFDPQTIPGLLGGGYTLHPSLMLCEKFHVPAQIPIHPLATFAALFIRDTNLLTHSRGGTGVLAATKDFPEHRL